MTGLYEDMDWFERRALELEKEQTSRYVVAGSHCDFWDSDYERMQHFLIERYRGKSSTWGFRSQKTQGL